MHIKCSANSVSLKRLFLNSFFFTTTEHLEEASQDQSGSRPQTTYVGSVSYNLHIDADIKSRRGHRNVRHESRPNFLSLFTFVLITKQNSITCDQSSCVQLHQKRQMQSSLDYELSVNYMMNVSRKIPQSISSRAKSRGRHQVNGKIILSRKHVWSYSSPPRTHSRPCCLKRTKVSADLIFSIYHSVSLLVSFI